MTVGVPLQNDSILYFQEDNHLLPDDLPAKLRLSRYELQIDFPIVTVNASNRSGLCSARRPSSGCLLVVAFPILTLSLVWLPGFSF